MVDGSLPAGFLAGHWSDRDGGTGCTVILAPPGATASGEVRGGGPGTREGDLLAPSSNAPGVDAVLLTGGSAYGLAAADGVVRWLEAHGRGYSTPAGIVPLVPAAVVYDLPLGDAAARPGPDAGEAACEAATSVVERGTVGVGTGCTVGKVLGWEHMTKGGLGWASARVGEATICALAAVNAFGEVLAEDGSVLAGAWDDGAYLRTADALAAGRMPRFSARESTTLVALLTDAALTKTQAWVIARAASAGVARAVDPAATAVDGDLVYCVASGAVPVEPIALGVAAAHVTSGAIRDGVRSATGLHGVPAAGERGGARGA